MAAEPIAGYRHITRDPGISGGEPIIAGSRITMRSVVECVRAGDTPESLLEAWAHVTAGQIYSALSYYYDHKEEIDRLIDVSQPDRVLASLGLEAEKVADGAAVVRSKRRST